MSPEKQEYLFTEYPWLFNRRLLGTKQSPMAFGICVGDGWFGLLKEMCELLTELDERVELDQVKEKFGTLRVYTFEFTEASQAIISVAETLSASTCEDCGQPGKRRNARILCSKCHEESTG